MKRRLLALVLAAALLTLALAASAGASGTKLTFFSINDTIPPELINARVYYNGRAYVPYTVFASYGLGISYTYFASADTAYFYAGDQHIFFELNTGDTYDGDEYHYSIPAIYWGGVVYVPLGLMCDYYGLHLSTITGSEYGDILRITNGTEYLTDEEFAAAAGSFMRTYYNRYNTVRPTETPAPTPVPTPEPTPEPDHEGEVLRLAFRGLPDGALLDALARRGLRSVFFLSPAELRSDPGLVRRICGEGHTVGLRCGADPAADWEEGRALLFAAARRVALLYCVTDAPDPKAEEAPEDAEETAIPAEALLRERGAVAYVPDYLLAPETAGEHPALRITGWLGGSDAVSPALLLPADAMSAAALEQVLRYVEEQKYTLSRPRETDANLTEGNTTT